MFDKKKEKDYFRLLKILFFIENDYGMLWKEQTNMDNLKGL